MRLGPESWKRTLFLFLLCSLLLAAIWIDAFSWLRGPFSDKYHWQWQWQFAPKYPWMRGAKSFFTGTRPFFAAVMFGGGLLASIAWSESSGASRRPRLYARIMVAIALICGFGFQLGVANLDTGGANGRIVDQALHPHRTSYLNIAASPDAANFGEYVTRHADLLMGYHSMAIHASTHPIGPILFYRMLIGVCAWSPRLTQWLNDQMPPEIIARLEFGPPASPEQQATGLLGSWLIILFCAMTCVPLYALCRALDLHELTSARIATLWAVLPGPTLMNPQFDQVLALFVCGFAAFFALALRPARNALINYLLGLTAGVFAGIAAQLSYGCYVFLFIAAASVYASRNHSVRARDVRLVFAAAATGYLILLFLPVAFGHHSLAAFINGMTNHQILTSTRRYRLWLLFNIIDFTLFFGVPIVLIGLINLWKSIRRVLPRIKSSLPAHAIDHYRVAISVGLFLLWLSGIVRGEVGRIWIPLMPLMLAACLGESRSSTIPPAQTDNQREAIHFTLIAFILCAFCVVLRLRWAMP